MYIFFVSYVFHKIVWPPYSTEIPMFFKSIKRVKSTFAVIIVKMFLTKCDVALSTIRYFTDFYKCITFSKQLYSLFATGTKK
jgi:hypothetical protein